MIMIHTCLKIGDFTLILKENVPGPVVYTTDELIAEIKNNDFDKNKISEFRKTQFNATDGEASKRVVDFLLNEWWKKWIILK